METVYIPGSGADFVAFIAAHKARWEGIEGHNRWIVTRDDGTEYIARPEEAKPHDAS